jgi:hypothetical protein
MENKKLTYQQEIKNWLSEHKTTHYKDLEDGIWKRNKRPYPHILPIDNWFDNLLPEYKTELKNYIVDKKIKRHRDFHHLNSSQAMCLNFFYPLIIEKKLDLVLLALGIKDDYIKYDSLCFEKDSEIELAMGYRPTSFDFYFKTNNEKDIYFEIKYTEQKFGKAKSDNEHFKKYDLVYKKHCTVITAEHDNCKSFLNYYQLMRNIVHVSEKSYVIFLYPENNKKIRQEAEFAKSTLAKSDYQSNIKNITWENLIEHVNSFELGSEKLDKHMIDFKRKYNIKSI